MRQPTRDTAHLPELPRVHLDTRMPAHPAPGGRTIVVGASDPRPRGAGVALGFVTVGIVVLIIMLFRWARHSRPG